MKTLNVLSYDVGGSGGKVQLGRWDGRALRAETVFRHHNTAVTLCREQYWDFLQYAAMRDQGTAMAAARVDGDIASIGTTAFGNNFVFLDRRGRIIPFSHAIYPERLEPAMAEVARRIPLEELHGRTGSEMRNVSMASQLMAYRIHGEQALLDSAAKFLLFPDALNYTLSGICQTDETAASIVGLWDPSARDWAPDILSRLDFPPEKFPQMVPPCTVQGPVLPEMRAQLGLKGNAVVVNAAGHDTASAVYALPVRDDAAFLSLGTLALIGFETDHIIANPQTCAHRLANCATPDRRNIIMAGIRCMWHMEKCLEYYAARGKTLSYEQVTELARQAPEMRRFIDLDDDRYLTALHRVPEQIGEDCRADGFPDIADWADLFRCLFDSMAWAIVREFRALHQITGMQPSQVYVLGGGGRNALLMQLLADCLGCPMLVPRYEATSYGVLLAQLVALGELKNREEAKAMILATVPMDRYEPRRTVDLSAAEDWARRHSLSK